MAAGAAALVLAGLSAGVLGSLSWILRRFPRPLLAGTLREVARVIGPNVGPGAKGPIGDLPPLVFSAIVACAVFTGLAWGSTLAFALGLAATLALAAGVALTVVWLVPLNVAMLSWPPDAPPAGYESLVERWLAVNHLRAALALAALVAVAVAVATT